MKKDDIKIVSYYMGKIVMGIGGLTLIPILTALIFKEYEPLIDFIISLLIFSIVGIGLELFGRGFKGRFRWSHGMVISALSWLVLMILSAVPYYLSGHFWSYLDAMFDVMSGFTTTGVILIQDIDHLSNSLNMWRHLLTFVGGQGMVVLALSCLITKGAGAVSMYVGEGKDEKLLPNVTDTAKAIWTISLVYLGIGTVILTLAGLYIGLSPSNSFLHGLWIFMAAWSTGGFAPQSQNILYYHNTLYESITIIFLIIGSFNFALHHSIWKGNKKEIYKNIEVVSFTITLFLTTALALSWFGKLGLYKDAVSLFSKVFYQMVSAHTTTGFMNVYANQFVYDWGTVGIMAMSIAMLIGGSACSTAGGIKGIRVGIFVKALIQNMKKLTSSENRVCVEKYHFLRQNVLSDELIKNTLLIIILYIVTFGIGVIAAVYYGYGINEAIFESASVTGNVGLTIGITSPSMPNGLKIIYIIIMWVARLEFISAFALVWNTCSGVKKSWKQLIKKSVL